jgi:UDP-N-acetylmuramate dehydrogenase
VIASAARRILEARLGRSVDFDVPLSRHTSLGVGGPADALATPVSQAELLACSALAAELGLPLWVLGGGFNTLVLDGGVEGLVLRTQRLRGLSLEPGGTLVAEAGVSPSQVMRFTVAEGLTGLEIGAGIPGSVGGWVAMNAGIPGAEVGDVVVDVEVVAAGGELRRLSRDAMGFVYRGAGGLEPGAVVAGARFALAPAEPAAVRAEIERHLAHRRATQPIDQPSFGSVWKNPPGERAGRLIELAGLKGAREGGAQISSVHANFIVNRGGATAADVLALMRRAAEAVQERTGIVLEPEVRIAGREAR